MSQSVDNIRVVLEREIAEIRTGDSVGVLFGLFLSVGMLASIGILTAIVFFPHGGALSLVGIPVVLLVASYFAGKAMDGTTRVAGADLANSAAKSYNNSWTGYGRERAVHGMQAGLVLMLLQFLAGAVYGTVKHFQERDLVPDDKRSIIAAIYVQRLLTDGPTKQNELFRTTGLAEYTLEEKRAALEALSTNNFVEALPTGVQLARGIREKF